MPWALTCAGVGAAVGEGEAFREPGTVARTVAEGRLPAPCSARYMSESAKFTHRLFGASIQAPNLTASRAAKSKSRVRQSAR